MLPAMSPRFALTICLLLCLCAGASTAQKPSELRSPYTPPPDNLDWKPKGLEVEPYRFGLTSDWFGLRSSLEEFGIGVGARLLWEASEVYKGGFEKRWRNRWFTEAGLLWELGPSIGLTGGSLYGEAYWRDGPFSNQDIGSIQIPSNFEGPNEVGLRELYYQQKIWEDLVRIKLGRLEGGREFQRLEYGMEFLNFTGTRSPGALDPSAYPLQDNGIEVHVKPEQELSIGLGVYDRDDSPLLASGWDGNALLFNLEGKIDWWDEAKRGRIHMGYFRHTGGFADGDGKVRTRNWGWYVGGEKDLLRTETSDGGARSVSLLANFTYGDRWVSSTKRHWQFGLRFQGLIPTRTHDSIGILGSYLQRNIKSGWPQDRNEFLLEAYYRIDIGGFLFLQPDLQYFVHPAGLSTRPDAWIATLRATLVF